MDIKSGLHRALEHPLLFWISQRLGAQTVRGYRALIRQHVCISEEERVLDIGCGIGGFRPDLGGRYCGIDINADYIAKARQKHHGEFRQMDCSRLDFADVSFDHAVTIATLHHVTDAQVLATIAEARRVVGAEGKVHIIEAILPQNSKAWLKRWIFKNDRGQHIRTLDQLTALLEQRFTLSSVAAQAGFPHDTCYIAVAP